MNKNSSVIEDDLNKYLSIEEIMLINKVLKESFEISNDETNYKKES